MEQMRGLTWNGASRIIRLDSYSGAISQVDVTEMMIHEGKVFVAILTLTAKLKEGESYWIRITTADTPEISHFIYKIGCNKEGTVQFFEDPIEDDPPVTGILMPTRNMNRNVINTYTTKVRKQAYFMNEGLILADVPIGPGGLVGPSDHWMLRRNTTYTIKFTAAKKDTVIFGGCKWFEQGPID